MTDLPSYDELPAAPEGGRSGWGLFGADDNVGLFNLLTPEGVLDAARLIRRGAVFPLDAALDAFVPSLVASRGIPRHRVLHEPGAIVFDDVYDNFYPQASSQWDSLGHVGYVPGAFYNGATEEDVASGRRNTIEHWARRGSSGGPSCSTWPVPWPKRGVLTTQAQARRSPRTIWNSPAVGPVSTSGPETSSCRTPASRLGSKLSQRVTSAPCAPRRHSGTGRRRGDVQVFVGQPRGGCRLRHVRGGGHAGGLGQHDGFPASDAYREIRDGARRAVLDRGPGWPTVMRTESTRCLFVSTPMYAVGGIGSPANALAIK